MSPDLKDLLFTIRQHSAFRELLACVEAPQPKAYSPSKAAMTQEQMSDWIYRSGRKAQHDLWMSFLTDNSASHGGIPNPSQQEIP